MKHAKQIYVLYKEFRMGTKTHKINFRKEEVKVNKIRCMENGDPSNLENM